VLKLFVKKETEMVNQIEQNPGKQAVDTAIANTSIHDCDDSTYEVHVSAATQHMLAQLRENFVTGLNIYSLIESTILKYAESHATKEYLLVKSTQAYKQLNESTTKELGELRQLVEVLKKENDELRNELDGYRNKATVVEEPVTEDDVENAPILVTAPDIEHSSEHTVTLSDEDAKSIKGNGNVESIKGSGFDTTLSITRVISDEDLNRIREGAIGSLKKSEEITSSTVYGGNRSLLDHRHPNPNGAGNGVYVSTGKPENNTAEKIHVTKYSEIEDTKM
jgi:hypothetical protein